MNEVLALVIGYLLGSIPTAYLATKMATGRDIRKLGGGNVGGLNTFREVGLWPAIAVGLIDFGKGAAAVGIAYSLLQVDTAFVLLAGLFSVIGHNWMVWLKFTGGKGMGAAIGSLIVIMPLYGYTGGLLIFLGTILVPLVLTRNVALSMGIGLLALPLIAWFVTGSALATVMAVVLLLVIGLKFLPTALKAIRKSGAGAFGVDHWQGEGKDDGQAG